jgi:predicted MFS family arabinose efflux permease
MEKNQGTLCLSRDDLIDVASHTTAVATPLRSWLSVISVVIGAFAFVTTEFLPVGLLPQIARDLHVLNGTAGLMMTVTAIAAAISAPTLLMGAKRIDRRTILLGLSVLLVASNLLSAVTPNFGTMLVARAMLGAALGGFWTVALAASGRLVDEKDAARATAMIFAGITVATVVGVPLGTYISSLFSWRTSFVVNGVLAAVALAAQAWLLPTLPSKTAVRPADLRALLGRSNPRKSLVMVALVFAAHLAGYTYITPFLAQSAGFSLPAISTMLLGFGIAGFVANFAISTVVTRRLQTSLLAMVALMMLSMFVLPLLHASPVQVIVVLMAWGIAYGAIPLCLSIWMQMSSPDLPEAGSALFVAAVQTAIALGSFAGGVALNDIGLSSTLRLGGVLALAGLAVIASFGIGDKRLAQVLSAKEA